MSAWGRDYVFSHLRGDAMTRSEEQRRDLRELDAQQAAYDLTLDFIATLDRRELGAIGLVTVVAHLLVHVVRRHGAEAANDIVGEVL
jgi:hypothetical protein